MLARNQTKPNETTVMEKEEKQNSQFRFKFTAKNPIYRYQLYNLSTMAKRGRESNVSDSL